MPNSLTCEQAIFTSTRTPMGEGYRIIAASRGLRPDEKQAITRVSPSHDTLCSTHSGASGMAFYPLPGGRVCAAVTGVAGNEHTGRGGQRVYTHNLIFDAIRLTECAFNPFAVLRAMVDAGLLTPQLSPESVLPEYTLSVNASSTPQLPAWPATFTPAARCHVLQRLLDDASLIVCHDRDWATLAELILLGVPGPLRASIPFAAGLRFSAGRSHRLHVLSDDRGVTRTRITGQRVEYVEPSSISPACADRSAWVMLVEHHWATHDLAGLCRRTSRPYTDVSPHGRERVGRMYLFLKEVPSTDAPKLIARAGEIVQNQQGGAEREARDECLAAARQGLVERYRKSPWSHLRSSWQPLLGLWRRSADGSAFADPVIQAALQAAMRESPVTAMEAALEIAQAPPPAVDANAHADRIQALLNQVSQWCAGAPPEELAKLSRTLPRWRAIRPTCPIVQEMQRRCQDAAPASATK